MQGVIYEMNDSPEQFRDRSTWVDAVIGSKGVYCRKACEILYWSFWTLDPWLGFWYSFMSAVLCWHL